MDHGRTERAQRLGRQLRELKQAYDLALQAPRTARGARPQSFFVFEVAGIALAVRAAELLETLPAPQWVQVPSGRAPLAGALSYRQEILQLLDLCPLLGLGSGDALPPKSAPQRSGSPESAPASRTANRALVLRPLQRRSALLADRLIGLAPLAPQALQPLDRAFLSGQFVLEGRPVAVLNTAQILAGRGLHSQEGP